ncbi:MAG: glycosyltransferase family 4 protein [Candidatus Eisenbacteria bacterium]|nr:glycosyltransferase family 4 protein [Candidatus Eisenbacteria bacterium]
MAVILYVNSTAVHGGAEEALLDIMCAAGEIGHRPVLGTPGEGWLTEGARSHGIPTALVPTLPEAMVTDSWTAQFGPLLPTAVAISRLARRHGAAIIHSNTPRTSYHGGLAARLAGVRAVTHCYDIIGTPYQSAIRGRLLHRLADWTLTISNAAGKALQEAAPQFRGRVSTLYYGFRPDRAAEATPAVASAATRQALFGLPSDALVIGCASAMTPWKGQDILFDAFRLLAHLEPRVHLVIVGASQGSTRQDQFEARLREQVAASSLGERVTFAGWREDWQAIVAAFDIFVHVPTQPDPLPLVVLHACRLGRPVIATPMGGIPEIVGEEGEAGVLVPASDAGSLARALTPLLHDPARRASLGAAARDRMMQFSWGAMRITLSAAYERVLGS